MRSHNNYIPRVLRMTLYRWKHSRLSVTLSKAGCTVLSKGTHNKTPAASNLDEWS